MFGLAFDFDYSLILCNGNWKDFIFLNTGNLHSWVLQNHTQCHVAILCFFKEYLFVCNYSKYPVGTIPVEKKRKSVISKILVYSNGSSHHRHLCHTTCIYSFIIASHDFVSETMLLLTDDLTIFILTSEYNIFLRITGIKFKFVDLFSCILFYLYFILFHF